MKRVLLPDSDPFLHGPGYFNKANQRYSFFFVPLKKSASKVDKHVMLSYLLLFNKSLEFDFF